MNTFCIRTSLYDTNSVYPVQLTAQLTPPPLLELETHQNTHLLLQVSTNITSIIYFR